MQNCTHGDRHTTHTHISFLYTVLEFYKHTNQYKAVNYRVHINTHRVSYTDTTHIQIYFKLNATHFSLSNDK